MTENMPIIETVSHWFCILFVGSATVNAVARWDRWGLIQLAAVLVWTLLFYIVILPDLRTL